MAAAERKARLELAGTARGVRYRGGTLDFFL